MADAPPPSYQDVVDKRSADTQLQSASFASSSSSSASGGSRFASLTLHCTDRLWVLGFPPDTYAMLDKLLFSEWAYCIQRRKELRRGCYEYKLRGEPCKRDACGRRLTSTGSVVGKDSTAACRLIIRLISALSFEGWTLDANIALSRTARNTNTLYFKEGAPRERKFSAVAFREYDKVRIIDVPVAVGEELVRQFKVSSGWLLGSVELS